METGKVTDEQKTVAQVVEEVCQDICDHYCKYPAEYNFDDDLSFDRIYEDHCNDCPLNRLH